MYTEWSALAAVCDLRVLLVFLAYYPMRMRDIIWSFPRFYPAHWSRTDLMPMTYDFGGSCNELLHRILRMKRRSKRWPPAPLGEWQRELQYALCQQTYGERQRTNTCHGVTIVHDRTAAAREFLSIFRAW